MPRDRRSPMSLSHNRRLVSEPFPWLMASLVVLFCLALPMACLAGTADGYDEHDYQRLRVFLEQPNGPGRNGDRIGAGYDPDDPSTWGGVEWSKTPPRRVTSITWLDKGLSGVLDLSGCTRLTRLHCVGSKLTSLDVSGCSALVSLYCHHNELTSLNVSGCKSLVGLYCHDNQLSSLDVSDCLALEGLFCYRNQLTSLDMSGCTALARVECHSNRLSNLDVSGFASLYALICYNNRLTSLDIGGCTALKYLECYGNQLAPEDLPSSLPVPGGRYLY
jgi:hypothetical protein